MTEWNQGVHLCSEAHEAAAAGERRLEEVPQGAASARLATEGPKGGGILDPQNSRNILGVDSLSILFNHRSLKKKTDASPGCEKWLPEKKDPWKEWGRYP